MNNLPDIDIDVKDRECVLRHFKHIPAYSKKQDGKHVVGVYFHNIPINPILECASIDFRDAKNLGYFKVDILNNSVYDNIQSENELNELIDQNIIWDLFEEKDIIELLPHIRDHSDIVLKMKPKSIEELAMVLALIRPAKKHLIGKSFEEIKSDIWKPEKDYFFKKSHAIAYALAITVFLKKIIKNIEN